MPCGFGRGKRPALPAASDVWKDLPKKVVNGLKETISCHRYQTNEPEALLI